MRAISTHDAKERAVLYPALARITGAGEIAERSLESHREIAAWSWSARCAIAPNRPTV